MNMPNDTKKRAPPFSLRLSAPERAALAASAGGMALGAYVRSRLFGRDGVPLDAGGRTMDGQALARLLAALGQSKLAGNLADLAEAARIGTLPVTPDTETALRAACATIQQMRTDLLKALGRRAGRRK